MTACSIGVSRSFFVLVLLKCCISMHTIFVLNFILKLIILHASRNCLIIPLYFPLLYYSRNYSDMSLSIIMLYMPIFIILWTCMDTEFSSCMVFVSTINSYFVFTILLYFIIVGFV